MTELVVQYLLVGLLDQIVKGAQAVLGLDLGLALAALGDLGLVGKEHLRDGVILDLIATLHHGHQLRRYIGIRQGFVIPEDSRVHGCDGAIEGVIEAKDTPARGAPAAVGNGSFQEPKDAFASVLRIAKDRIAALAVIELGQDGLVDRL